MNDTTTVEVLEKQIKERTSEIEGNMCEYAREIVMYKGNAN